MTKTSLDITARALQLLGVVSVEERAVAEDEKYARDALVDLFAEVKATQGFTWTWTIEQTPDGYFLPMSKLLASEIAPHWSKTGPSRSAAIGILRAMSFPDDREDRADIDSDGTVSTDETAADKRGAFY